MRLQITFFAFLLSFSLYGQSPQGVSYQAVATDAGGVELVNQNMTVRFTIVSGTPSGVYEYVELHNASTDDYGLFNLTIGQGSYDSGNATSLADIDWGNNTHYLKVDMDIEGGNNFVNMGTQQMMSVPYALYAETAGNASEDGDTDSTNEIQTLSIEENTLSLSNGGGEVMLPELPPSSGDGSHIYIECVDMGVSLICGSLGLSSSATLQPNSNMTYYISNTSYPNDNLYFDKPHWRKFQIFGLHQEQVEQLMFRYRKTGCNPGVDLINRITTISPEVGENEEIYFYMYSTCGGGNCGDGGLDCVSTENINISIPTIHGLTCTYGSQTWQYSNICNNSNWEIFYKDDFSWRNTGVYFDTSN